MSAPLAKAGLLAAAAAAACPAAAVFGRAFADEKLTGSVSETLRFSSNPHLDSGGSDPTGFSTTRLGLNYLAATPRSTFGLSGSAGYTAATGGSENDDLTGVFPDVTGRYGYSFDDASFYAGFGVRVEPSTYSAYRGLAFDDSGNPVSDPTSPDYVDPQFQSDAIEIDYRVFTGFSQSIDELNSYNLSFNARRRDYTSQTFGNLVPNMSLTLGGGWNRVLSPTLSGGLSTSLSYYTADDEENRESYTWRIFGSFGHQVSELLSVSGRLGPTVSYTSVTDPNTDDRSSDLRVSGNFGLNASYAGYNTSYYGGVSNDVVPDSEGALSNVSSLNFGLGHAINTVSRLSWRNSVSYRTALYGQNNTVGGGNLIEDRIYVTSALTYSYSLTDTVSANMGYSFNWRDTEGESAMSHNVFLTLSKSFTLLP